MALGTGEAEQHPLKATWAPAWLSGQPASGLDVRGGRRGSTRPGRQGPLPRGGQHLPVSLQDPPPPAAGLAGSLQARPGAGGAALDHGDRAAVPGSGVPPPARRRPQLYFLPGAPSRPRSHGDFPSYKAGRLALPSDDAGLGGCGATAATGLIPKAQLRKRAPGPQRRVLQTAPHGWDPGPAGPSWPPSLQPVKPADFRRVNMQAGPGGSACEPSGGGRHRRPEGQGQGESGGHVPGCPGRAGLELSWLSSDQ